MKIKFGKLFGWIVLDIFVVGVVKEAFFNEDFNLLSFLLDIITYNFTHFSFLGLIVGVEAIVFSIYLFFTAVSFIIFSWLQLKKLFSEKSR